MKPLAAVALLLLFAVVTPPLRAQDLLSSPLPKRTNEPVAPGIDPKALWDGRKLTPFKSLDFPKMVSAGQADFLDDADYVLGITINGESRAYPTRFVWFHHVVNDKVSKAGAETFFAVSYCSVCNTGIAFDPMVNGKPVRFDFFGLYNGVVTLCERETESVLLQVTGEFVRGPLLGTQLKMLPILDTTWGKWKALHPDTAVMSPDPRFQKGYRAKGDPEPRGYDRFPAPFFKPTVTRSDKRLPPFDKVLAVSVLVAEKDGKPAAPLHRAYPIKALQESLGVVNDTLGNTPLAVLFDPKTTTAVAVSRFLDGKTLTLEARKQGDGTTAFYDKETGTRWSIEGVAEDGPLKGKRLEPVNNHLSQWYGWVAYYPETTIYGRTDPPQPAPGTEVTPEQGSKPTK
jgi:hypothetical protein